MVHITLKPLSHGCVMFEYFEHTGIVFMVMDLRLPRGECCGKCDRLASTYTSYLDNTTPGMLITNIFTLCHFEVEQVDSVLITIMFLCYTDSMWKVDLVDGTCILQGEVVLRKY